MIYRTWGEHDKFVNHYTSDAVSIKNKVSVQQNLDHDIRFWYTEENSLLSNTDMLFQLAKLTTKNACW
jgi:hypothetical protein